MKHLKYLRYVLLHKFYVMIECWKRKLFWLGIIHDWSKFLPSEWFPYVENFYGEKPTDASLEFDRAWLHHIHWNKHHPQHWYLIQAEDDDYALPIPYRYLVEMLCDWKGAGRAKGTPDTIAWYQKNSTKMLLNESTRKKLELMLYE